MTSSALTVQRRKALCDMHSLSDAYIYQCIAGHKSMAPAEALRIERLTDGELSRRMLRPHDYWLIWPDLPTPAQQEAS